MARRPHEDELDRIYWHDGSTQLAQQLARTVIHSPPTVLSSQLGSMALKRTASLAGLEGSPGKASVSSSASATSLKQPARRRRRLHSQQDSTQASSSSSLTSLESSRILSQRLNELARRLTSNHATPSPLQESTNAKNPARAAPNGEHATTTAPTQKATAVKDASRSPRVMTSPPKPPRTFAKTLSGPVLVSAPPCRATPSGRRVDSGPSRHASDASLRAAATVKDCAPAIEPDGDLELEEGDSFDMLLSQTPSQSLDALFDARQHASQPRSTERRSPRLREKQADDCITGSAAVNLSQELLTQLCEGIDDWNDDLDDL